MKRVIKLIIIKSSLISFTTLLLSVSASPVNIQKTTLVDTSDLMQVRDYNERTLKQIDYEFQRAAQFKEH